MSKKSPAAAMLSMSLVGSRSSNLDMAKGRMVFVSIVFVMGYILIAICSFDLAILQGELERIRKGEPVTSIVKHSSEKPLRADIVDRNGVLLATTLRTASLYANPGVIIDPEGTSTALARIFPNLSEKKLYKKLTSKKQFVWITRNLIPDEQAMVLEIGDPGLAFRTEPDRIYPQGSLSAHVVGFSGVDGNGLSGIERGLEERLAEGGEPVRLSIDIRLQHFLHREIASAMKEFKAKGAAGLIMDVSTGEVLASVSLPDFDPHDPGDASQSELFNRSTLGVYEAGSIFKIFSLASYIDYFNAGMGEKFDAREPLVRGKYKISDFHPEKRIITLPEVFIHSSNIGAALMGEKLGSDTLQKFYSDLGLLNSPEGLEIPEIGHPLLPSPWREINTLTASYGHGIASSPLQIVSAVSTIVGDGTLVRPVFVISGKNGAKGHENASLDSDVRIVKPQTSHRMRQLMRLVVTEGTGSKADVPGYQVGGKTGTAEKSSAGGYDRNRLISSFVGVFPMEAPRYAVFVMIDEPKGNRSTSGNATGGWVAAPAVGKIIAATGSLLGVPVIPESKDDLAASLEKYIQKPDKEGKRLASN